MTPWELTPQQLNLWREARAEHNAGGFAEDPVGLVDFIDVNCTEDSGNATTIELHFPLDVLALAKAREPFLGVSAVTGADIRKPMSAMTCLEWVLCSYFLNSSNASYIA
jgi:hypothetical protein